MMFLGMIKIRPYERGLLFRDGAVERLLKPGRHVVGAALNPFVSVRVERLSIREPWLRHLDLDVIAKADVLGDEAQVLDLRSHERAVVSIDGRVTAVIGPGVYVLWNVLQEVQVEVFDAREITFDHPDLRVVLAAPGAAEHLTATTVAAGWVGLLYRDGRLTGTLEPGLHAAWKGEEMVQVFQVDLREQALDVSGQEIMTADRVTLRLNALAVYRVVDATKAVTEVEDHVQALYRQAQLALRAIVGTRELDTLLSDKDAVARELEESLRSRATAFGVEVRSVGVRDVILPGDMKEILNRVTEAKKAAESALITRREETAAMRSQANTARIFEKNPTLMRLRELEVLEKVADKAQLSIILGEGGLAERVVKML